MIITPFSSETLDALPDWFWASSVDILEPPATVGEGGHPQGDWTPVAGMAGIPCRKAPLIDTRPSQSENRRTFTNPVLGQWHLQLKGYYPEITTVNRVRVDGVVFNVVGIEHDGNLQMTRLRIEEL